MQFSNDSWRTFLRFKVPRMPTFLRFWLIVLLGALFFISVPPLTTYGLASVQTIAQAQRAPMQLGQELYQLGQYASAAQAWQQAANTYKTRQQPTQQASALSNLALAYIKLGDYTAAENAIATAYDLIQTQSNSRIQAQILSTYGQLATAQGDLSTALSWLQQAIVAYQASNDTAGELKTQLNRAKLLRVQGQYGETLEQLEIIYQTLETLSDDSLKAEGLRQLGEAYRLNGDTSNAQKYITESREIARPLADPSLLAAITISLGDLYLAQDQPTLAAKSYQEAATLALDKVQRSQAKINWLTLKAKSLNTTDSSGLATIRQDVLTIQTELAELPPSRASIFMRLNLVDSILQSDFRLLSAKETAEFLGETLALAQSLDDYQSQAYVLGALGNVYGQQAQCYSDTVPTMSQETCPQSSVNPEKEQDLLDQAETATQRALTIAEESRADVARYRLQAQLGGILVKQGRTGDAIEIYQQAKDTLDLIRRDLIAANPDLRFSFRDEVEPLYRQLVELLLEEGNDELPETNILQAQETIESLQVAELVDFFRADCVITDPIKINEIDQRAAVIYPIILDQRLEILLSLPDEQGNLRYTTTIDKATVNDTLDELRKALADVFAAQASRRATIDVVPADPDEIAALQAQADSFLEPSQQLYDWLIRPLETKLEETQPDVLVFVLDGALRNVPMAALQNKQTGKYLIENYPIALTPGLQLLDSEPLQRQNVKALVAGLSELNPDSELSQNYNSLPNVETEVETIRDTVPGSSVLLNDNFLNTSFEQKLTRNSFPVVHLATHGEFSSDLDETFVVTWDDRINANQLSELLQVSEIGKQQAVELLVLSACETAVGDNRAALGLAGIAVRSGARSTLASLWKVDDEGTSLLMQQFYKQLRDTSDTKAKILQQAQLSLIEDPQYKHPYYWSAFVLVGNWL